MLLGTCPGFVRSWEMELKTCIAVYDRERFNHVQKLVDCVTARAHGTMPEVKLRKSDWREVFPDHFGVRPSLACRQLRVASSTLRTDRAIH